ncbi:MAG TPA: hypothetical protein VFQ23_22500 [Anaerolineales bacterium]|nr:hypothetical protein [Anaerolineales bacterium]
MKDNVWSVLGEFTNSSISENLNDPSNSLIKAMDPLHLPDSFLQRLMAALQATMNDGIGRPSPATQKVRILSNYLDVPVQGSSSSWGFFFIEKDQEIELYLFQDRP